MCAETCHLGGNVQVFRSLYNAPWKCFHSLFLGRHSLAYTWWQLFLLHHQYLMQHGALLAEDCKWFVCSWVRSAGNGSAAFFVNKTHL